MELSKVEDKRREGGELIVTEVHIPKVMKLLSLPTAIGAGVTPALHKVSLVTDNYLVMRRH